DLDTAGQVLANRQIRYVSAYGDLAGQRAINANRADVACDMRGSGQITGYLRGVQVTAHGQHAARGHQAADSQLIQRATVGHRTGEVVVHGQTADTAQYGHLARERTLHQARRQIAADLDTAGQVATD